MISQELLEELIGEGVHHLVGELSAALAALEEEG